MIEIDEEFRSVIPPPTAEELAQLEANLLEHGCLDPLKVWYPDQPPWFKCYATEVGKVEHEECDIIAGDDVWDCQACRHGVAPFHPVLLDGHNRLELCTKHGIEFETAELEFETRTEALLWVIQNQLGRRNLEPYARVTLALKGKELLAAMAKENLKTSTGGADPRPLQNSAKAGPIDTREEIARAAGVSHDTVHKVETINKKAPKEIKQQIRNGETSINAAYQEIRQREAPTRAPLPDQTPLPFEKDDAEQQEAVEATEPDDEETQAVPNPADVFARRWMKTWEEINTFYCSLPRRGGIVKLVRDWSPTLIEGAIHQLRELAETCTTCADELERTYR